MPRKVEELVDSRSQGIKAIAMSKIASSTLICNETGARLSSRWILLSGKGIPMNLFRLAHGSKRQEWACESQTNSKSRGRGEFEARGPLRLAPLTGRDTELSLLKDRWEQAQEGVFAYPRRKGQFRSHH